MPIGELAVLASAMMFSVTGVIQKTLVSRFRPLTLGALGSGGGAVAGLIFTLDHIRHHGHRPCPNHLPGPGNHGRDYQYRVGRTAVPAVPEERGREQGLADDSGTPFQLFPAVGDIRTWGDALPAST